MISHLILADVSEIVLYTVPVRLTFCTFEIVGFDAWIIIIRMLPVIHIVELVGPREKKM